ncbi:hypothetical protein [Wolbachia endosymbiont (group B) of Erebia ligea]|uniref:hypothetical protein n=1 Tax=Wolbachia endosymbiont (group B) of Erebia ligea TaxID=2954010 RepID=UPI0021F850ED|nr:hypothetical protein [Wolbachia endosymbiont (group B) of Erebia ligea]
MPKYEELNETQQRLYDQLQTAMKEGENIIDLLLRSSKIDLPRLSKEDFLTIFSETNEKTQESIIGTYEATRVDYSIF